MKHYFSPPCIHESRVYTVMETHKRNANGEFTVMIADKLALEQRTA